MKALTHRQRLFVEAYISTRGNGTEAMRRAGYRGSDKALAAHASRMVGNGRVAAAIKERTEKVLKAIGGPTPEEVMQTLADQMRGGRFFRVDERTGEPIIDLRGLAAARKLHLVKRVTRTSTTRRIPGKEGTPDVVETTKTVGVELHSAQDAAEILGRFLGMDKSRPEQPSALVDARAFVVGILESGDPEARAALDRLSRLAYPGPPDRRSSPL